MRPLQKRLPIALGAALACLSACLVGLTSAVRSASARGFVCGASNGSPATLAITKDGNQVPVIRWTSATFNDAGWSPQRRCEEVSDRFSKYLMEGRLNYITTGRMNGLPVICTARTGGGGCDGLLYTLKPGQDASATLRSLLEIRVKARGPLYETTSRIYVSIDELLEAAQATANTPATSSGATSTNETPKETPASAKPPRRGLF
jgi:hypothetical protein